MRAARARTCWRRSRSSMQSTLRSPPAGRERFDQLRDQVRSADDGHGLPEALLHGNLLHAPDHVIVSEQGPVAIQWKAAGRGPRLADFAYLMWGTWLKAEWIDAAVAHTAATSN